MVPTVVPVPTYISIFLSPTKQVHPVNVLLTQYLLTNGCNVGIEKSFGALYEYREANKFCVDLRSTQMQYLGMVNPEKSSLIN